MHFKDFSHRAFWGRGITKTFWRVMKLTGILMLIALLHVSAAGLSQKVTLSVKNAPLEKVFDQIKQQTGLSFLWDEKVLSNTVPVTIDVKDAVVSEVLDACLKNQGLSYSIIQNMVVIKKSATATKFQLDNTSPPIDIHGHVTDSLGNPLVGASITVKGSKKGTSTDANGDFSLKGISENSTINISFTGYDTKTIKLNNANSYTVNLVHSTSILDQVQIIAYGTTTQRLSTGDVTTVTSDIIEKQPVSNPLFALEGRVPGMYIAQATGVPGSGFTVLIRGQNSIGQGNSPMYIIDGVPYVPSNLTSLGYSINLNTDMLNPLNFINPLDIGSIDVLKDADATAIYGSRGANGVVLITTKRGLSGKTKIDLSLSTGQGTVGHYMDLLNTQQYLMMRREAFANDGIVPDINSAPDLISWDTTKYTNWQKQLLGGTAKNTNAQVSISGGNKNTQFLISGNYRSDGTVFPGDFVDKRGSFNLSLNNISDNQKLKTNINVIYLSDNNNLTSFDPTTFAITLSPNIPSLTDSKGNFFWPAGLYDNPYASFAMGYFAKNNNLIGSANIHYQILPELELLVDAGFNKTALQETTTEPVSSNNPAYGVTTGTSQFANNNIQTWNIEPQINWRKIIAGGKLNVLFGCTFQQTIQQGYTIQGNGYTNDLLLEDVNSAGNLTSLGSTYIQYRYNAFFGKVNYNIKDKYLINLTARRDGSSRFGPGNQFANFGAVGGAWIFSNERFVKENFPVLSFGKLKGSYGVTGNDQIPNYGYQQLWGATPHSFQNSPSYMPLNLTNPTFGWERDRKLEFGINLGFFNDRILLEGDWYESRSNNQLLGEPLPTSVGFFSVQANLPALVQNTGIEIVLNTINIKTSSFSWTSSINLTVPRNILLSYPGIAQSNFQNRYTVGKSLYTQKLFQYLNVNPTLGVYQFQSVQGDSATINPMYPQDLQGLKQIAQQFYGGFLNSFTYKGLQLDIFIQFVKQTGPNAVFNQVFNPPGAMNNQPVTVLNRWQKPGDNAQYEKFTTGYGSDYTPTNSWYSSLISDASISDGSFVRLKNISLSYNLPNAWLQKVKLTRARIYVQGQNLFTITSFKGFDPEYYSVSSLPPLRTITAGIQLTF